MSTTTEGANPRIAELVARYVAVWSEPDPAVRAATVAELWTPDGVEFIEGAQFRGPNELADRLAEAYETFVQPGTFDVTAAHDLTVHGDVAVFTIELRARTGEAAGKVAWDARVFLSLNTDLRIREDYHLTIHPIAA